jgi:O-antigen/teichoic acid export membrane protein
VLFESEHASLGPTTLRFSSRRAYLQTFGATAVIRCLGVISGVLAARLLGPTGRGELAVIIFLPMLLVPLGDLELPRSLAFEFSRPVETPSVVIATSFWIALILGAIQGAALAVILPAYLPADKLYLVSASRWFVFYLPAAYVTANLLGADQGRGRFGRLSLLLTLPGAIYVLAILVIWMSGQATPQTFAGGVLVAAVLAAVIRTRMDWAAISGTFPDWGTTVRLLRRGFTYYWPAVAGFVLSRADIFILVRLVPSGAIGMYAVAQAIALGQIGAINPFIHVGFSAVAGETDSIKALHILSRHFRFAQLAVIVAGLLAGMATPTAIRLMFGAQFNGAITATYLLIGATGFWGMELVLEQGLRAAGHPTPGIISNAAGLAVLFGLGIPACLRSGIKGLAAASLAAQFLNLSVLIGFCVTRLKMPVRSFWGLNAQAFKEISAFARSGIKRLFAISG